MTADLSPAPREDRLDFPPPTSQRFAPVAIIRALLHRVFVEPVRDGFPVWRGTPAGLAAIMIAATVALGTALLLAGLAPQLRAWLGVELSPIGLSAPIQLVWLLVLLLILALSLLQTAALHTAVVGPGARPAGQHDLSLRRGKAIGPGMGCADRPDDHRRGAGCAGRPDRAASAPSLLLVGVRRRARGADRGDGAADRRRPGARAGQ